MAVLRNLKAVSNSVGWGNNNAKTHYICLWYLEKKKKKRAGMYKKLQHIWAEQML